MQVKKITAKIRDMVKVSLMENDDERAWYNNIEMPEEIKDLEMKDFRFNVLMDGKIEFQIIFEPGILPKNFPENICYNVQTAVDAKNKLLVDFEITNSAVDKNQLARMVGLAADALGEKELEVTADVGYDSATDIAECLMRGATPHVSGVDYDICLPTNDGQIDEIISHTNGRGIYLANRNIAVCPMGHVLYPGGYKKHGGRALFYNYKACTGCICKCTAARYKKFEIVMKSADFSKEYDDKNLRVKQVRVTASKAIVRQRKSIVEHPFGTVKRTMDAGYCLTKGKHKVSGEMSLAFLAYNLKRVINIIGVRELIDAVQA